MHVDKTLSGVPSRTDPGFGGHFARALRNGFYTTKLECLWFETPMAMSVPVEPSGEGKTADAAGEMEMEMSFQAEDGASITAYDVKLQVPPLLIQEKNRGLG